MSLYDQTTIPKNSIEQSVMRLCDHCCFLHPVDLLGYRNYKVADSRNKLLITSKEDTPKQVGKHNLKIMLTSPDESLNFYLTVEP